MKHGSDWYKRDPLAYLGGVQGLTAREHAVYGVVLDLIYAHGGSVNNDPKWIAGWISDMGSAAVRKAIASLVERRKLVIEGDQITQIRAKNEVKTKENLRETAVKSGKKGGKKSAEVRADRSETNSLPEATASTENQADKTRLDKSSVPDGTDADRVDDDSNTVDFTKAIFDNGVRYLCQHGMSESASRSLIGRWRKDHNDKAIFAAFTEAKRESAADPRAFITAILKGKPNERTAKSQARFDAFLAGARSTS